MIAARGERVKGVSTVPMPNTATAEYAEMAGGIRRHLARRVGQLVDVFMPPSDPLVATPLGFDEQKEVAGMSMPRRTLTVQECAGPAPFVGDPLWQMGRYVWRVALDGQGGHVAGDAWLEVVERPARAS